MATKTKKTTYTVRLEWDVTYFLDVHGVEASTLREAAEIAIEEPNYVYQESYDDPGDTRAATVTEDATGIRHDMLTAAPADFATVAWRIEDIQERMPEWSEKQCQKFLDDNADAIQTAMIDAGGKEIDFLLP